VTSHEPERREAEPGWRPPDRRDAAIALGIFAFALGLRLAYLGEIRTIPFFEHLLIDARSYDDWSRQIAGGQWWGDRVFYQAPAYPYFLASVRVLTGGGLWAIHVAQMVLGALSCVALFFAGRLFFDRATGSVTGLLLAVYPPAIFFDGLIQKAGLGLLGTSCLLLLIALFQRRPAWWIALLCGAVLGLLALTRENSLIFVPAIPLWMALRFRAGSGAEEDEDTLAPGRGIAAFALGLILVLAPVGVRNFTVGSTFAITTSQMGTNFYIGNHSGASGIYEPLLPGRHTPAFEGPDAALLAEEAMGRSLTPGEVSRYWLSRSARFIGEAPGEWLALLASKALMTLNRFEIPDTEDIYVYAEDSRILALLLPRWHFGILLPLAAAGAVFAWPRRRDTWVLYALSTLCFVGVVAFYVFGRYRYPLVPLLLPLAGYGVVEAARCILAAQGRLRRCVAPGLALCAAALLANLELFDEGAFRLTAYTNMGYIMLKEDRLVEADRYLSRAMAASSEDADLQLHMGALRYQQGRLPEAEQHLRYAAKLEERDHRPHLMLARVLRELGRTDEARRHRRVAATLAPAEEAGER